VIYLRFSSPELKRPFKTPFFPVTPILGAIMCVVLLMSLMAGKATRHFFLTYLALGIVVYFVFGIWNSKLGRGERVLGGEPEPMELPQPLE
jgi:APA family basic amino acid/polyamine antiporter